MSAAYRTAPDTLEAIRADLGALVGGATTGKSAVVGPDIGMPMTAETGIPVSAAFDRTEEIALFACQHSDLDPVSAVEGIALDRAESTALPASTAKGLGPESGPEVTTPLPHRDSLAAIRWELDALLVHVPALASITPVASLERATTLWRRQALERAIDHAAAMLDALGLPQLVTPDFVPLDGAAIGDAVDNAVAALDAFDGDPDLEGEPGYDEPEGDDERDGAGEVDAEHSLGWAANASQLRLHGSCEYGDELEHTALERHGRGFARAGEDDAEEDDPAEHDFRTHGPAPILRSLVAA